jgi:hypothetical protein
MVLDKDQWNIVSFLQKEKKLVTQRPKEGDERTAY